MQGLLFPGDRQVIVKSFPDPEPGPGEVRVAMRAAAVCGSDLHGYRASAAERTASGQGAIIPGHEPSGVVDAIGYGVTGVSPGDRVAVYHYRGCGRCAECRGGRLMWCHDAAGYGGPINGSDADLLITDARNCLPLPDDMSFTAGALLTCVAGTAFQSLKKLGLSTGDTLAVFGLGPVGLTTLLFARVQGIRTVGVDVSTARLKLAEQVGADAVVDAGGKDAAVAVREWSGPAGVGGALETSGTTPCRKAAVAASGRRGRVVFVGFGSDEAAINPASLINRQVTLMGSFVFGLDDYEPMVQFVRQHSVPLESIVTHRQPLQTARDILPACDRGETGKVIFTWE